MIDPIVYYTGLRETRPYLPPFEELNRAQRKFLSKQVKRREKAINLLTKTLNDIDHSAAGAIYTETRNIDREPFHTNRPTPAPRHRSRQATIFWGLFERIGRSRSGLG